MTKAFLISSLILLFSIAVVQTAVIGIDFGTEFYKISLISPGKSFIIIENTTTKRKTPTAISFLNGERVYEADATAKRNKNPQNSFVFVQKYLGALANNVKIFDLAKKNYEDYLIEMDPERNTLIFELKDFKLHDEETEERVFLSVEEVTAMILRHAKRLSEKQASIEIKDCVITVPGNWNLDQKRALLDAASLAGLHVLAYIGENTAGALYYGIERSDNETHTVLFYNLGSSSLKVSLVEYLAVNSTDRNYKKPIETIKVLADTVMEEVSGLAFDQVLANHFADIFDNLESRKHKSSIRTSNGGMIKLLKECNKLKEVLSANKQTPFYVENLFDGEDFKTNIERFAFEEKAEHLFSKLLEPIKYVLQKANRTLSDVSRLEILGGAVRIPKVQQILSEYLNGVELGAHLNGDEAMAFGAAFHAANLSHSFKVRPIWLYDGNNFEVELHIRDLEPNDENYEKKLTIFPYKQRFGSRKVVSLSHDRNLRLDLLKKNEDGTTELLTSVKLTNISDIGLNERYAALGKPKLHIQFTLLSTWPTAQIEAEATLDEIKLIEFEEFSRKPKKAEKKSKEENKTELENENIENSTENSNNSTENQTNESSINDSSENNNTNEPPKKQKKKTITHYIPLKMKVNHIGLKGLNSSQIEISKRKLLEFDKHEEFLKKNSESKNKLESFIYKVRDHLAEENFVNHASPIEKDLLSSLIVENDDWLYSDEAYSSNHSEFNRRFHRMYSTTSDILHRVEENKKRPAAVSSAYMKLIEYEKKIKDLNKSMPWVNETHKAPAMAEIANLREWIEEKLKLQEGKPLYEDPVFTVGALEYRIKDIKETYINLKNIKKPKEKKKRVDEEEEDKEKQEKKSKKEEEKEEKKEERHEHDQDLEEKNPENEQISEREDL